MSWNRGLGSRSYRPTTHSSRLRLGAALVCLGVFVAPTAFATPPVASASAALDPVAVPAADTTSAPAAGDVSGGRDVIVNRPAPAANDLELALFTLTNADRAARGIGPLALDTDLLEVARARAAAQVPLPALSHYDAAGGFAVAPLLAATGVPYRTWGENLARLPGPDATTARRAEDALMNSPGHRENLLDPGFDHVAIGAAADASGRIVFAEVFRTASPA